VQSFDRERGALAGDAQRDDAALEPSLATPRYFLVLLIKKRTPKIVSQCCSIVIARGFRSTLDAKVNLQKYTSEYL
jgi:hypothetical protein